MNVTNKVLGNYAGKVITIREFCDKYHDGVTPQAIDYAIKQDIIDYLRIGRFRYIVLTDKTLAYTPNPSSRRATMSL